MNKKRNYIVIFLFFLVLTIGIVSIDYFKQLGTILAEANIPNPGHALDEIEGSETLVRTSGDQSIAGTKTFVNQIVAPKYCIGDKCIESWSSLGSSSGSIIFLDGDSCPEGYFIDRIFLGDCHVEDSCQTICDSLGWLPPGDYYCRSRVPSPLWGCASTTDGPNCLRPISKVACMKNDYNNYYISTGKQTIYGEKIFKDGLWIGQNGNIRVGGTDITSVPNSQLEVFGDIDLRGNIKTSKNPFHIQSLVGGTNIISLMQNGDVGVGKTPTTKFDVNGKIRATEIEAGKIISSGSIKIGNSSLDCSSSEEGSVKYNQLTKGLEVCNGSSWVAFSQKACQLDGEPQTTLWGENQYECLGDDHRCFNGQCRKCEGSLIGGKCWYSVGANSPCSERGGIDDPYYADPSDCTICSTLVKNTNYWLGQTISCEGSSNYGPMAVFTGTMHYNPINCYYHNSSSNRETPSGYPPYMSYGGIFWAPCKY